MKIPKSHPRFESLQRRERLVRAWKAGVVVPEGLIAHGRGEAFDYLLGEETTAPALVAEKAAAAFLVRAARPVISVNGNVAALAASEVARLAKSIPATVEVNLFHRTEARVRIITQILRRAGAPNVLGLRPDARIPKLESKRAVSHRRGVFGADVVLDAQRGPLLLELNARPGLSIQSANQRGLLPAIRAVTAEASLPESVDARVQWAMARFGGRS